MEHSDLVAEMAQVEHLSTQDRLHLARMRRAQQLKVAKQREKEWLKAQRSKDRMGNQQHMSSYKRHITFEDSVVLLEAAARNDIAEVAKLLQKGVTPDATNMDGLTALHQCCIDDNAEMLNLLLDFGANVNAQDSERWTPLHAAATCGHLNLVKILIARGANLLSVNADGNMPYDICDDEEALDYIEAEMSKRGVTQELIDETRAATETQMLKDLQDIAAQGGDLEVPDSQGATPLHIASANGYTRAVEFLLEQHVSTDAVDHDLWTPVHAAACWGHLEVLEMLAQSGADLNAKNKNDETPSDICEDPEIRERIEQLKSEQESKRLAEAQRKRVRRSQSNNTRAQSVRRTSLRDKGLTTKKDAVEEARFRLQAQEGYTTPDGAPPPAANNATTNGDNNNQSAWSSCANTSANNNSSSINSPAVNNSIKNSNGHLNSVNNNNSLNNGKTNNGTNVTLNNGLNINNTRYNNHLNNNNNNNNNISRKDQNYGGHGTNTTSSSSSAYSTSSSQPTSLIQYDRRSPEGKDNDSFMSEGSNGAAKMLNIHNNNNPSVAGTLADLKKHRSQNRSSVSPENGSLLSGQSLGSLNQNGGAHNNAMGQPLELALVSAAAADHHHHYTTTHHHGGGGGSSGNGSITGGDKSAISTLSRATGNGSLLMAAGTVEGNNSTPSGTLNKFSGNTSDVVSDSTRSRRCCVVM
ncbi:protein phosphatase 1 regulatory subunit 16A isoform X4 [Toxorhynchites rutilus septentrionalis]|uniref:protein phosphatase 1 regulatory subunit 16A isoform X4 n=1 Tax=Toxorhynchites rutilus septentrionalis TaxID=329112 RepID=UPI0024791BC1|nr:protein phosphatase 1 regulatory subunit 16A isoform X4 [Toxorhynchites rutilus septentrionalis]